MGDVDRASTLRLAPAFVRKLSLESQTRHASMSSIEPHEVFKTWSACSLIPRVIARISSSTNPGPREPDASVASGTGRSKQPTRTSRTVDSSSSRVMSTHAPTSVVLISTEEDRAELSGLLDVRNSNAFLAQVMDVHVLFQDHSPVEAEVYVDDLLLGLIRDLGARGII